MSTTTASRPDAFEHPAIAAAHGYFGGEQVGFEIAGPEVARSLEAVDCD